MLNKNLFQANNCDYSTGMVDTNYSLMFHCESQLYHPWMPITFLRYIMLLSTCNVFIMKSGKHSPDVHTYCKHHKI